MGIIGLLSTTGQPQNTGERKRWQIESAEWWKGFKSSQTATCAKRPHWDRRYYIKIIHGQGELVRPCPAGAVFVHKMCGCEVGLSGFSQTTLGGDVIDIFCVATK